jgi:hypothetical protein
MDWLINDALPVLARIFIVWIFPFSFLDKVFNWNNALKQANSGVLPGGPILLVLAMAVELLTPPMIVYQRAVPSSKQVCQQVLSPLNADTVTIGAGLARISGGQHDHAIGASIRFKQQVAFAVIQSRQWVMGGGSLGHRVAPWAQASIGSACSRRAGSSCNSINSVLPCDERWP